MGLLHIVLVLCVHACQPLTANGNWESIEQIKDIQFGIKQHVEYITQKINYFNSVLPILSGKVPFKLKRRCEGDWKQNGASCFLSVLEQLTFKEAKNKCSTAGGYLAELTSEEENQFVALQFKGLSYIGGQRMGTSWKWINSGRNFDYRNWRPREPNNYGGNEGCIEIMLPSHRWNDLPCTFRRYSICEKASGFEIIPNR